MEFNEVISSRRSVRKYRRETVPEDKLQKLFAALNLAPSGNNHQPYRFIFVTEEEKRRRIASEACHQEFLFEAPVLMVACCEQGRSFDTAIAVDHLVLAAVNEGLGTCWVGWFERDAVRKILHIPDSLEIPILIPIGYTDEHPAARPRKPWETLVSLNVI